MKSPEMGGSLPEKESAGIKEKLANLEQYMAGEEEIIYEFARFLSTRAHNTLVPQGFDLMAAKALYDLQNGKNGSTGEPIQGELVGCPPQVYNMLKMYVPEIKEVIFGKEK